MARRKFLRFSATLAVFLSSGCITVDNMAKADIVVNNTLEEKRNLIISIKERGENGVRKEMSVESNSQIRLNNVFQVGQQGIKIAIPDSTMLEYDFNKYLCYNPVLRVTIGKGDMITVQIENCT